MRFVWVLFGSVLSTAILFGFEVSHDDLRLAFVLLLLIIVLLREHLSVTWWYRSCFLTWLGITFLAANWLQVRAGRGSEAVFVTFGPVFLIIALYEIIWHRSTLQTAKR